MNTQNEFEAVRLLESLASDLGVLRFVQWLATYEGAGGEVIDCEFGEDKPCVVFSLDVGDENEETHCLPGRRVAPLLEDWLNDAVEKRRRLVSDVRSLAIEHLPRIFETFGCEARDFDAELDRRVGELHARGLVSQDVFPWTASIKPTPTTVEELRSGRHWDNSVIRELNTDPIIRSFHRVFLDQLDELLPRLAQGASWSSNLQTFIPLIEGERIAGFVLRAQSFGLCTQVRVGVAEFCERLFAHLCEVIAYYRVRADEAQQVLDTTLPQLIEKMKSRGVW